MIIDKKALLVITLLSFTSSSAFSMNEEREEKNSSLHRPRHPFLGKEQRYTSDLSESYRISRVATQEDYEKMENKFKEDFLKKGYKGQYWTQENVDKWEISQDARDQMNVAAQKPFSIASKKEYFKKLNEVIKGLKLKKLKPTDISDLSESYRTSSVATQEDYEKMENKFEEDYWGGFWTQEKVDDWEISDTAREKANSILEYCGILKKTPEEFYEYWLSLHSSQQ